ncbi:D-methionine transport system substrate-binding protein [Clostridium acetobutylicum]|jgi:D-methionine transport system substrate-binding protein|uniref:Lipoprotein n=1 Tax=Clostridium acetobutylicum (strain ATCC 824 / DSM 792 / JCM 1419 / IAM 19013 / LMG 5710 / NBRC 13948 / NRRL B-527 / VKM B-1787 / 2291 / W) TaxID=272562 RepID=Q97KD3_CLOAB|nr:MULTISPECIES: MetQ/NlpA family ABC transporter substrate-binding protein [Clostridium]AAK78962.1 Lipoprotein, attached to the cytoplasmic membrane, NLPA family [Clostridium acetobutylicum ATCC 824]ADZ20036.1 Lipoprotein, attached to the cytoplasmic membrane, NLPA family [Clostridium acetobutylicum EA 2018]AEI33230.1 NLPA family lipoprotein [Clostridium acetobutylicum DSM 1731]AWV81781.1 MetQ/NlpA family ABC transporter substrate-binding protein [Clostridium acetobutylicum]KHD35598.1 methion
MKKKFLSVLLSGAVLIGALTGCSSSTSSSTSSNDKKTIVVGATAVPHAEILNNAVKPLLKKEGYTLKVKVFTDYVTPNTALNDGDLDANYFQHVPYLETFNKEKHMDLTYTVKVHIEPMGLYSHKIKKLSELKDGDEIAVPNDSTNESRALKILEQNGIIKLKKADLVTKLDIIENKKNIKIKELDAAQLPRVLDDVTASIINSNYALQANLNPTKDAIVSEPKDAPYANVLAVRKQDKDKPYIKALNKALTSPEVKKYINDKYKGEVVPAF